MVKTKPRGTVVLVLLLLALSTLTACQTVNRDIPSNVASSSSSSHYSG
jgi:predicted small secreted protein